MTTLRITLQVARLKVLVCRLIATRPVLRMVRRSVDWMAPAG